MLRAAGRVTTHTGGPGTLKVLTHGRKLKRPEDDYIRDIIDDSGLGPLIEGTHSMMDRSLVSAFTERWHRETSSFHLPAGEMTITLDDVSTLLHLPDDVSKMKPLTLNVAQSETNS
ncbi:Aminotransferase-like, plant mobile domain [Sesbania bispinosa]|nr:Aminotransferase-like, plant mobile domain [Sesbania bispinosa]